MEKRIIQILNCILWSLVVYQLYGQTPGAFISRNYTRSDGLSDEYVRCATQDSAGFIWVGTLDGFNRFDGYQFEQFFLPQPIGNTVNDILALPDGRLALATKGGLYFFDPKRRSFTLLDDPRVRLGPTGLENHFTRLFPAPNGRIYAGAFLGAFLVNPETEKIEAAYQPDPKRILETRQGFVGEIMKRADGLPIFVNAYDCPNNCLTIDFQKGTATPTKSPPDLLDLKTCGQKVPEELAIAGVDVHWVHRYFKDRVGNYWGIATNGLRHFYRKKAVFEKIPAVSGWLAAKQDLVSVNDLLSHGGKIWLATGLEGLLIFDENTGQLRQIRPSQTFHDPGCDELLNFKLLRNGNICIGSMGGWYWLDPRSLNLGRFDWPGKPAGLDLAPGVSQLEDSRGNIWLGIGNGGGVVRFNPEMGRLKQFSPKNKGGSFPLSHPTVMIEDETGRIWFGNKKGGGLVWTADGGESFSVLRAGELEGFESDNIQGMISDGHGHLWMGSLGIGLLRYDVVKQKIKLLGRQQGVLNTVFDNMLQDNQGHIWLTTAFGLHRLNPVTEHFDVFFKKDGLTHEGITGLSLAGDTLLLGFDGDMVFGSLISLVKKATIAPVQLTRFRANGNELPLDALPALPHNENDLQIEFAVPEFLNGRDLLFAWRLKGGDTLWHDNGNLRSVNLSNLQPGKYLFEAKAMQPGSDWNAPTQLVFLEIRPPWWQTWWFMGLSLIAVGMAIWGVFRYRLNQVLKIQKVRDVISRDLHDDIGATLTNLEILSRLGVANADKPINAKSYFEKIAEEISLANENLHQIVWNVQPQHDDGASIIARLTRLAAETLENAGIALQLEAPDETPPFKMGLEKRRDLFLIFKESLTNIVKHAQATEVRIRIHFGQMGGLVKGQAIHIHLADNGRGFDIAERQQHGNGLKNLFARAEKWGGNCHIASKQGTGATVEISLPM